MKAQLVWNTNTYLDPLILNYSLIAFTLIYLSAEQE